MVTIERDDFMLRPLAQKIVRALDALDMFWCFGKTHRPEEIAKRDEALATLAHMRATCPVVYNAVMKRLGHHKATERSED